MTTDHSTTNYIDLGAVTIWIASFANLMPSIAALLSIIWFAIRILETKTVQRLLGRYAWIKEQPNAKGTSEED